MTALALVGLPVLWRRGRTIAAWILCWGLVPIAVAIALTFATSVSYNARYAITAFPAVAIVAGAALSRVRSSWLAACAAALGAVVVFWSLRNWYSNPHYAKDDLRSPVAMLAHEMQPGDVFVMDNATATLSLDHYGWTCTGSTVVIHSPAGAGAAATELATRSGPGSTWLLLYRPWESDPSGLVPGALSSTGDGQLVGDWPGSALVRYEGTTPVSPADGLTIGCKA